MPVFRYLGVGRDASVVRGTISADTPRQARDQLRGQGLQVRRLAPCSPRTERGWSFAVTRSSRQTQWATAIHELSMLLHAGIPMLDALDTLTESSRGSFRAAILAVRDRVAAGSSLAAALAERPDLFDAASVQMVEVGENSGSLEAVLAQLAEFKRRQLGLRDAVTTALIYPLFLLCFGTAAALFLMTSVLPPLLENLAETVAVLPWPTRVAKSISDTLLAHGWVLAIAVCGAIAIAIPVIRSPRGKAVWHRWLLRLPILGSLAVKQGVSRMAMIIATLTRSGVELTRAVELAEKSTSNVVFRGALAECRERISAGEEVAEALQRSGVFPPLAIRVFSVGQDSGKLDEMLFRLASDYDEQVETASKRLTSLLEPILILVLAALVGFLLLATILPILEAGNVM